MGFDSEQIIMPCGEWQDISTAPRDGTVVDLFHKNGFRVTDQWWDESDECWVCLLSDKDFIAWMPIPGYPEFAA